MQVTASGAPGLTASVDDLSPGGRTHPRVQVIALGLCAAASAGVVAATHLPWFGFLAGDPGLPEYSAVSGMLVPPGTAAGLVPGTRNWGYLVFGWAVMVAVSASVAAIASVVFRRHTRVLSRLLVAVGVASLVLVALVVPELLSRVQFDIDSFAGADWGAFAGLGLAVLSSAGAWFAWATWTYPHRWGLESSAA